MAGMAGMAGMATMARPTMATPPVTSAPLKKLSASAFKPVGPKPTHAALLKLIKKPTEEDVAIWQIRALGGPRWLTAVHGRNKGAKHYWFKLVLVEHQKGGFKLGWAYLIDAPKKSLVRRGKRPGVLLKVGDFDHDGKREADVRYRFPIMYLMKATNEQHWGRMHRLAVINLDGARPRLALRMERTTTYENGPPTTEFKAQKLIIQGAPYIQGHVWYRDLNADGHPDLLLKQIRTDLTRSYGKMGGMSASEVKTEIVSHYVWQRATDAYRLTKRKKRVIKQTHTP
jgi:hypothetical protein